MAYPKNEPIAIVGSACRFAGGVNGPQELWNLLQNPKDVAEPIPQSRFGAQECATKAAYFLGHGGGQRDEAQHKRFDARFFGISRGEADAMDPQVRLLLEVVHEAVEGAAGCPVDRLRGSDTAVYAGVMAADYERVMTRDGRYEGAATYHGTGTSRALAANRVSHSFDWRGPSLTVDTACSSSLVAVHLAVQQLRAPGGSRLAVATGACLLLDALPFVAQERLRMLSPAGRSRMWDAAADGYARGEGVAAVALKTLRAAEEDGDVIECVIRETGVNQDGWTGGITVPSARAQERLIRDCYIRSGLDPRDPADRPQFFEAHGTGTPTGDPIEAEAIYSAFFSGGEGTQKAAVSQPLFVGVSSIIRIYSPGLPAELLDWPRMY
ncbi:uncharacterized protein PG986_010098 [Apiospora aurea]|uniref:Ketosynthase family 3 (KS3) domain-containing protein n=1 Tax=Apiospora aurea TaxID=335848 RepID=A0ABR1QA84_9PEZI